MKAALLALLFAGFATVSFSGCRFYAQNSTSADAQIYGLTLAPEPGNTFAAAKKVITTSCVSCHSAWASYSQQDFVNNGLVSPSAPLSSLLWTKLSVNGGNMPQSGTLSTDEVNTIRTWLLSLQSSGSGSGSGTPAPTVSPPPSTDPAVQRAQAAMKVLSAHCISCHSTQHSGNLGTVPPFSAPVQAFLGGGSVTTLNQYFIQNGLVVQKDIKNSWIYESLRGYGSVGSMPAGSAALSSTDAQSIATWINGL